MSDSELEELLAPATCRQLPPLTFSLDDVVRHGQRARRRRSAAAASVVVLIVVSVGGGFAFLGQQTRSTDLVTAPTVVPLATQVEELLAEVGVPAGATVTSTSPVAALDHPDPSPVKGTPVVRTRWWTSPMTSAAMSQWVQDHQPPNANGAYSDSAGGSYRFRYQIGEGDPEYGPTVDVTVVPVPDGSDTRVDVWASAPPPRQADTLLSAGVTTVDVRTGSAVASEQAYSSTLTLSFDGQTARSLVDVLNGLSPAPAEQECTPPPAAVVLLFHDGGHVLQFSHGTSCPTVAVLVDGKPRASLLASGPELDATIASLHLP